jgi:putative flippase GtrA
MWALNVGAGMPYLFAQVIATGIVLLWNFTANKLWTFGAAHEERR